MRKLTALSLLLLALLLLGGCGSSSSGSSTSSIERKVAELEAKEAEQASVTGAVDFEAHWTKTYSYTADSAKTEAGRVSIGFTNPQKMPQDIAIENSAGKTIGQTKPVVEGSDSTIVNLKPGTYHYYSTLPGHREKGMEGTLTVTK